MHLKFLSLLTAGVMLAACGTIQDDDASTLGGGAIVTQAQTEAPQAVTEAPQIAVTTPAGTVPGTEEDLRLNVGDRVFFGFDRSTLKPEARTQIQRWAAWMNQYPSIRTTIEGHCDARGTREYNLALGERRSNSALEYLVSLGISPNRISVISYGKERPAVLGADDAVWAQNRRAVLRLN